MITKALLWLFRSVVDLFAGFLPDWDPIDMSGATQTIVDRSGDLFGLLRWADYYFPVSEALAVGLVMLGVWLAAITYFAVVELLQWSHVLGGGR